MKHLISREDYITENLRISKNVEQDNELNEGLLDTLFGGLKMLLKKDWENIKCKNPSVLPYLQDIDKSLAGYTMTKMQFSGECQNIRQNIANYFSDIIEFKLKQLEETGDPNKYLEKEKKEKEKSKKDTSGTKSVEEEIGVRDKTVLDSLKKYKENIKVSCSKSPKLREWADQLLNSVEVFVNDIIIAELDKKGVEKEKLDAEKKKMAEERKKLAEERKKKDEENKKIEKEALEKLNKERDDAIRKLGVNPIGNMEGDKCIDTISKQFKSMIDELNDLKLNESILPGGYANILDSDIYIGIKKSLEELDWSASEKDKNAEIYQKFFIRIILNKINSVFEAFNNDNKIKSRFKEISSQSVQSMMIALSNAVIYGFKGDEFNIEKNKERLSLITKCAIDSDATIGFNLPLIDDKKPENGNYFVAIMNQLKNSDINSKEVENAVKLMSDKEVELIAKFAEEEGGMKKTGDSDSEMRSDISKFYGPSLMKEFRQNMAKLVDMIVKYAKKIKETAEKKRQNEAQKAQQQSEANEKNKK